MKLEKFDYQIGNKRKKKTFLLLGLVCLGAFITVILYRTFASYKVTNSYNIIGGKVADFSLADGLSMYLVNEDGTELATSIVPMRDEYIFDSSRSSCQNGTEIVYNDEDKTITIDETAGDTCNVYFNYVPLSKQTLYALGYSDDDIKIGIPYGPSGTNETGFYAAEDDYGTSYYYYTASDADMPPYIGYSGSYYFLIRINGNGSIRLIEDSLNLTYFNLQKDDNKYIGFMYDDLETENEYISSNVKLVLEKRLATTDNTLLDDVIFCNDRSLYVDIDDYKPKEEGDLATGVGADNTYYGSYYRMRNNKPTLKCPQKEDAFTVEDTLYGNGLLDVPVGLLTVDEAYMTNLSNWLWSWKNSSTGTMSPAMFKDSVSYIYGFDEGLNYYDVSDSIEYQVVINLKYGTEFTGSDGWFDVVQ